MKVACILANKTHLNKLPLNAQNGTFHFKHVEESVELGLDEQNQTVVEKNCEAELLAQSRAVQTVKNKGTFSKWKDSDKAQKYE